MPEKHAAKFPGNLWKNSLNIAAQYGIRPQCIPSLVAAWRCAVEILSGRGREERAPSSRPSLRNHRFGPRNLGKVGARCAKDLTFARNRPRTPASRSVAFTSVSVLSDHACHFVE